MKKITNRDIHIYVEARLEFVANSTSGNWYQTYEDAVHMPMGRLPGPERKRMADALRDMQSGSGPMYVVHSYYTPIAWWLNGVWDIPNVKYTATTSCAQGRVRQATNTPT